MLYLVLKAAISGMIIAIASETAKRFPGAARWLHHFHLCRCLA
jgi:hypothetical protein